MSKSKEPTGVIMRRPLPTDKGTHLLFINRPASGMFSQAGTAIFAVDSVIEKTGYIEVDSEFGVITFSKDLPFLVVPRALCRPVTVQEIAKINVQEKKDWEKAWKKLGADDPSADPSELGAVDVTLPGHYL